MGELAGGGALSDIGEDARAARSYLYVPGTDADRLAKAESRGADAIIADLEDSVAVADKQAARDVVAAWLEQLGELGPCQAWVRVNPDLLDQEIAAIVSPGLTGVVVPKAEPALLAHVDELLTAAEGDSGLGSGRMGVIGLIETARGLVDVAQVAASPRVAHLGIGEADLIGELRLRPSSEREELTALRLQVVVASAAGRIGAPVAPTSTDFRDLELFRRTTQALLRLGFRARTAIHPAQVPIINEVFTPSEREVVEARALVERFERGGSGVMVDERGRMVDAAVLRSAHETLARAPLPVAAEEGRLA